MDLLDDLDLSCLGGNLSDDFFSQSLEEMIREEKQLMCLDGEEVMRDSLELKQEPVQVSSVAFVNMADQEVVVGYKYPQVPRYSVINDMKPAKEVFSWVEKYYQGDVRDFPVVSVSKPSIPHSRYEKVEEYDIIDQVMLARGFRILEPSVKQKENYASHCDEEQRESVFIQLYDEILCDEITEENEATPPTYEVYLKVERKKKYRKKITDQLENMVEKSRIISYFKSGDEYEVVCLNRSEREKRELELQAMGYTIIRYNQKVLKQKSTTRYFARKYLSAYDRAGNTIVGFDFNPYSPYAASQIERVHVGEEGVKYERKWKDLDVVGTWYYRAKRYHSDVWYPEIFSLSRPYNRALMSLDLVVNSYKGFERSFRFEKEKRLTPLTIPLIVDPFVVNKNYVIRGENYRAPVHYRVATVVDRIYDRSEPLFLSYVTLPCRYSAVVEVDRYKVKSYVNDLTAAIVNVEVVPDILLVDGGEMISVLPQKFHEYVRSKLSLYTQGNINEKEYAFVVKQCQQYFVQKESYVDMKIKKRTKGCDKIITYRYKIWRQVSGVTKKSKAFEFVPYAILRYPHNRWGSLVSSFSVFSLEQFLSQYSLLRHAFKDPPWLHEIEQDEELNLLESDEEGASLYFSSL